MYAYLFTKITVITDHREELLVCETVHLARSAENYTHLMKMAVIRAEMQPSDTF
jgi:hypothetical protein